MWVVEVSCFHGALIVTTLGFRGASRRSDGASIHGACQRHAIPITPHKAVRPQCGAGSHLASVSVPGARKITEYIFHLLAGKSSAVSVDNSSVVIFGCRDKREA